MTDLLVRKEGRAGRITLNRPKALNALTYEMCLAIDAALIAWATDPDVALLIIDGAGEKAFCAGGDIAEMYATGRAGDYSYGRTFWADEYRMNARLHEFPKPVVSFLQGYTMGGGVGVGCHGSHRIVGDSSRIAMPECGIGLLPDVGGTLILAKAPGHLGEYLGCTGDRMDAADAIFAGFADHYIPEDTWEGLKASLVASGDVSQVLTAALPAPHARLQSWQTDIDAVFGNATLDDIHSAVPSHTTDAMSQAVRLMQRNSPLAMAAAIDVIRQVRAQPDIRTALGLEYRFTYRAMEHGDFIEGIRAAIIDRDKAPKWRHANWQSLPESDVQQMTQPLGADAWQFEKDS